MGEGDMCHHCGEVYDHCTQCDSSKCLQCEPSWFIAADGSCHPEACVDGETIGDKDHYTKCTECGSYHDHQYLIQDGDCVYDCGYQYEYNEAGYCEKICDHGYFKKGDKCLRREVDGCDVCERQGRCTQCADGVMCDLYCEEPTPIYDYFKG